MKEIARIDSGTIELQKLKNSPAFFDKYTKGIQLLVESGLLQALRVFCRPVILDGGESVNRAAAQASFVEGYHAALDDIVYFEQTYLKPEQQEKSIRPSYGAEHIALQQGGITQKELNDRRK